MDIKDFIERVKRLSIIGQESCGNLDSSYYTFEDIEILCNRFEEESSDAQTN